MKSTPPAESLFEHRRVPLAPRLVQRADKLPLIEGYAAVFYDPNDAGTEYKLWSDTVERIRAGAFDRALQEDDVRGLFNHDANQVLGRAKAGTLRLSVDARGLKYEIDPPDTQPGRDATTVLGRGDVDGSSFTFIPLKVTWEEQRTPEGQVLYIRWLDEVMLYDVGPVTFPAYQSSAAGVRAVAVEQSLRKEFDAWAEARLHGAIDRAAADRDLVDVTLAKFALLSDPVDS